MPMHKTWVDFIASSLNLATGVALPVQDLLFDMHDTPVKTLDRLIIGLDIHVDNSDTNITSSARVDLGIGVCTREAFDAGVASVPQPAAGTEYPARGWLYAASYYLGFSNSATFGIEQYTFQRIDLDLKAARKVDKGVLFLAGFNTAHQGTTQYAITGRIRSLMLIA